MEVAKTPPPKRVLYIITKANWGGAQRYVYDLALASKLAGYDVAVAYGSPGELEVRLRESGIRIIIIEGMGRDVRLGADVAAFKSLLSILKSEHPDIVHINSSKAGAMGTFAARWLRIPHIIFTAHAWAFNEARPVWQKIIFKIIHALTIILSHRTICVSQSTCTDMKWVPGSNKKLVVIRNGIRETAYKTREEARASLWPSHTDGRWIGMLSELHPTKRIDDAIEAVKEIQKTTPDIKLVVLGEGEERERLTMRIRDEHLENLVHLAGFVPNGPSYLHAFDYFLHTSRTDALAYAVIEAGLAGLPVVATNVGGIPEVIENGVSGILVPPSHPELLSEALSTYIENPERASSYGHALERRIREKFSMDRMIKETLDLYSLS